jgi:hypothetical protein
MYQHINELWLTVQPIQFCPSLQLLQSFFQNIALEGYLTQKWMVIMTVLILTFVDRKQQKMSNFHFDLSLIETFRRGGAELFKGGAKRSQGRCAPSHPPKIQSWVSQPCVVNLVTFLLCHDCIRLVRTTLYKSGNAIKLGKVVDSLFQIVKVGCNAT